MVEKLAIHHNVVWNCGRGIIIKGDNNQVFNNTVFLTPETGIHLARDIGPHFDPERRHQNTLTINNLAPSIAAHSEVLDEGQKYPGDTSHNRDEEGVEELLKDYRNLDFRPRPGSDLIDAGRKEPDVTAEYSGAAPDIGAYEHGGEHWLPGHRNGVWIATGGEDAGPSEIRLSLTMPVTKPVQVHLELRGPASELLKDKVLEFCPESWMQPRSIESEAEAGETVDLTISSPRWGRIETEDVFECGRLKALRRSFPKPDLIIDSVE